MSETELQLEKLQHEVKKLKLEIDNLGRPFILQPTAWFTMIGLLISISVNISQCSNRKNEETLSEINVKQATLESAEARKQIASLNELKAALKKDSAALTLRNENAIAQIEINEARLTAVTDSLNKLLKNFENLTAQQTATALNNVKEAVQRINTVSHEAKEGLSQVGTLPTTTVSNKLAKAMEREREGFQALLDEDFAAAAAAFQAAENAYNGYHWVYELARFMRVNKNETDPEKRAAVLKTVVTRYAKGAPADLLNELKKKVETLP